MYTLSIFMLLIAFYPFPHWKRKSALPQGEGRHIPKCWIIAKRTAALLDCSYGQTVVHTKEEAENVCVRARESSQGLPGVDVFRAHLENHKTYVSPTLTTQQNKQ